MSTPPPPPDGAVWVFSGLWRCIAHNGFACPLCIPIVKAPSRVGKTGEYYPDPAAYSGRRGRRDPLSVVGDRSGPGLACPKCGGTQFTAKRSVLGKAIGGVLAPKSEVKCVTCGTIFKRG